jgi:hypothetical protein
LQSLICVDAVDAVLLSEGQLVQSAVPPAAYFPWAHAAQADASGCPVPDE